MPYTHAGGRPDVQELIGQIAADAQHALDQHERSRIAGDGRAMALSAHKLMGLRTALGRVLAWRDGLQVESVVAAFNRGRDYQDQLVVTGGPR